MRISGFTLIELLIVLALMGLAVSLVGPATIQQVEKSEARAELHQLKSTIRSLSSRAFTRSGKLTMVFENNVLSYHDRNVSGIDDSLEELVLSATLEYTYFPIMQSVTFNSNGYPEPEVISIVHRGNQSEINLFRLIEATEQ